MSRSEFRSDICEQHRERVWHKRRSDTASFGIAADKQSILFVSFRCPLPAFQVRSLRRREFRVAQVTRVLFPAPYSTISFRQSAMLDFIREESKYRVCFNQLQQPFYSLCLLCLSAAFPSPRLALGPRSHLFSSRDLVTGRFSRFAWRLRRRVLSRFLQAGYASGFEFQI